jgi:CRP-like cAMP-binding protein
MPAKRAVSDNTIASAYDHCGPAFDSANRQAKMLDGSSGPSAASADLLIRKLESIGELTGNERDALRSLKLRPFVVKAHEEIVSEGNRPSSVSLVLSGFVCRYKVVPDGKRQIVSFHIPGDIPDLPCLFVQVADHNFCSLTTSQVAAIPHARMLALFDAHPRLAHLFWRDTLVDAAIFREWMVGIGRRSAFTRMAHLFCELIVRMQAVGLFANRSIEIPLTQADIADALGLSTVHVNRTLQEIRAAGLITFWKGKLVALDWNGLCDAGEFEPGYLHSRCVPHQH